MILTFILLVLYSPNEHVHYLLDPHLSMRIRIQEAFLYADPCGSGSETLAKMIYRYHCCGSGRTWRDADPDPGGKKA